METLFEYYIQTDNFHIKYAKGEPALKDTEFHDYNEFVLFLNGTSFFLSKDIQKELSPGNIVLIPKEHFHQFCVAHPLQYERLIFGFHNTKELDGLITEVMDTIKIIPIADSIVASVFKQLIEVIKSNLSDGEKKLFASSCLNQLLIHLKLNPPTVISDSIRLSPIVSAALNIIDENYSRNLSIESIADSLYVSSSTLSHKFSKELNISLYRYITKKRLSVAHEYIKNGVPLTSAASISGFNDYSCFYRLYRKYYK